MKKLFILLLAVCLISGCSAEKSVRTTSVNESNSDSVNMLPGEIEKNVPEKDVEVNELQEDTVLTLFDYNVNSGMEYEGHYDLNNDGSPERIRVSRVQEHDPTLNCEIPFSKIEVNDESYLFSGDIGAYDIIWVGVCDIDVSDGTKDIAFIDEGDAGNRKLCILKYDKSGTLSPYKFRQNPVWGSPEEEDCLHMSFAKMDNLEIGSDGTICAKNYTLSQDNRVAVTVDVQLRYSGNMVLNEVVPSYYSVDMSALQESWYEESLSGEELEMCRQGYIKAECEYTNNGVTLNSGDYFKVTRWREDGFLYVEKKDGNSGWVYAERDMWGEINSSFFVL